MPAAAAAVAVSPVQLSPREGASQTHHHHHRLSPPLTNHQPSPIGVGDSLALHKRLSPAEGGQSDVDKQANHNQHHYRLMLLNNRLDVVRAGNSSGSGGGGNVQRRLLPNSAGQHQNCFPSLGHQQLGVTRGGGGESSIFQAGSPVYPSTRYIPATSSISPTFHHTKDYTWQVGWSIVLCCHTHTCSLELGPRSYHSMNSF